MDSFKLVTKTNEGDPCCRIITKQIPKFKKKFLTPEENKHKLETFISSPDLYK